MSYPALDNKLHKNTEMSNYPLGEEKKPSAYSKPGCESKQASSLHQPTSAAKPSLSGEQVKQVECNVS